jgi:hypothetical protein
VYDGVIHFKIRHSLIDIRYFKTGLIPKKAFFTEGVI